MAAVSLTGNDVIKLNGRILSDLADGDTATIEFPNDIMQGKTGKGGTTLVAFNSTGRNADVTIRVIRGSADDKFLNSILQQYLQDPAGFVTTTGEFIKRAGNGQGEVTDDIYSLESGIPQKIPSTKENVEGDTEQSVTIWNFRFYAGNRVMA